MSNFKNDYVEAWELLFGRKPTQANLEQASRWSSIPLYRYKEPRVENGETFRRVLSMLKKSSGKEGIRQRSAAA